MGNKKVLITGSTGLLGLSLVKNKPAGFDIYSGYYDFPENELPKMDVRDYILFDIRKQEKVMDVFKKIRPDIVVHAASIGNVDYCEKNKEEAWQTNVEGSRDVIEACKKYDSTLIFTSSNAVFDGEKPPYSEDDETKPIDYYGKTKLQTEVDIANSGIKYVITRLMTMYGWHHALERQNPVTWVLEKLKKKNKINIVNDIYNNHLFVDNASEAIWAIILKSKYGIYHIGGGEIISRYELSCRVAEIFGLDKGLITPVDSSFFTTIAPRPKNTSYSISKMEKGLSVKGVGINEGLTLMRDNPPREWRYER